MTFISQKFREFPLQTLVRIGDGNMKQNWFSLGFLFLFSSTYYIYVLIELEIGFKRKLL